MSKALPKDGGALDSVLVLARPGFAARKVASAMKITFGARYTLEEFGDAIGSALQTLKDNGADGVARVSIYLSATKGRRYLVLTEPDDEKRVIEHLEYDPPVVSAYRSAESAVRPADDSESS